MIERQRWTKYECQSEQRGDDGSDERDGERRLVRTPNPIETMT